TSLDQVDQFLTRFPDGKFRADAAQLRSRLQGEEKTWAEASSRRDEALLNAYLKSFPSGSHTGEANRILLDLRNASDSAFRAALATKDPAAMQKYLNDYKTTTHRDEALARINEWTVQREWERVKNLRSMADIDAFRMRFRNSPYEAEALAL